MYTDRECCLVAQLTLQHQHHHRPPVHLPPHAPVTHDPETPELSGLELMRVLLKVLPSTVHLFHLIMVKFNHKKNEASVNREMNYGRFVPPGLLVTTVKGYKSI